MTICVIFVVSRIVKWLKDPLRKIPGPRGFPVIGNTLDYSLSKDLLQVLLERSKKYGKVYKDYSVLSKLTNDRFKESASFKRSSLSTSQ